MELGSLIYFNKMSHLDLVHLGSNTKTFSANHYSAVFFIQMNIIKIQYFFLEIHFLYLLLFN